MPVKAVIFDLGGVLLDWTPEPVYAELIPDAAERKRFLAQVCNTSWRLKQDAGQPIAQGTEDLVERFPEHEALIRAFYARWPEMLRGTLPAGIAIFDALLKAQIPLYAMTNWSAETWPYALAHYPFLQQFRQIVVSGQHGMVKPDPALYRVMQECIEADRAARLHDEVAFVDDTVANVDAARRFGWRGIHHLNADQTYRALRRLGLPI
jgi:2-haloacid dehalogenase